MIPSVYCDNCHNIINSETSFMATADFRMLKIRLSELVIERDSLKGQLAMIKPIGLDRLKLQPLKDVVTNSKKMKKDDIVRTIQSFLEVLDLT